ncbi:MAG: class I SAM-dependent methyltransferase [Acidimicrobiales bacterium]
MERPVEDYLAINRANWDSRVPHHVRSYGLERFRTDPRHLSATVRFDLPRLGGLSGKKVVHLQCHIGDDTLSLHRLGAQVTGLDFSAPALDAAREFARDIGADAEWVQADVYSAAEVLPAGAFDLVYTGIGALCWIPTAARWAQVVAALLKPGGELFIREGHPMLWSLCDPRPDGLVTVDYPYFETQGEDFVEQYSYVAHDEPLASPSLVSFNHGLAQIFNGLWQAGFEITLFEEHDSVPWNALGDCMVMDELGEWRLKERPERLAATYTLRAVKR